MNIDKCVKHFDSLISKNYKLSIESISKDEVVFFNVKILGKNTDITLTCNRKSCNNPVLMEATMIIEEEDGYTVSKILTIIAGCWKHGNKSIVEENMKGCGIGTILMLVCECIAIYAGSIKMTLDDVTDKISGKTGFYESLGYNNPDGDEVMEKKLSSEKLSYNINEFSNKINSLTKKGKCNWIWMS
jgi:hypothetical protein